MKKSTGTNTPLGGELRSAKVVEQLAAELRSGRYAGQSRLPAEVELATDLGVSRTVVRDALSELEREGFVERVRGIGTVVNRDVLALENRIDHKLEFYSMIRARGYEPHSSCLEVTKEAAELTLANSLNIPPGIRCFVSVVVFPRMIHRYCIPAMPCRFPSLTPNGWRPWIFPGRYLNCWSRLPDLKPPAPWHISTR